jgi:hypothetical protein
MNIPNPFKTCCFSSFKSSCCSKTVNPDKSSNKHGVLLEVKTKNSKYDCGMNILWSCFVCKFKRD